MSADPEIVALAQSLVACLRERSLVVATAESCTGGLVSAAITEIAGSSDIFDCGFVTYSNAAKAAMLGVPEALIAAKGAVSAEVAQAMAVGAIRHSRADLALSVTGIAGPGGGSATKPVGLVYVGALRRGGKPQIAELRLGDIGRAAVRRATLIKALEMAMAEASR